MDDTEPAPSSSGRGDGTMPPLPATPAGARPARVARGVPAGKRAPFLPDKHVPAKHNLKEG